VSSPRFRDLIHALHGHAPYEWQERAAAELSQSGWWPSLRAPTGAGKTSLIDCWLHALAVAGPDRLGRRLVWVVDRRAVVDQIYAYADWTVAELTRADAPAPLRDVAGALRAIGGGRAPRAVLWRGGLDDESAIAMRDPLDPAAVAVVVSTVDQLGSRLLFRGYGLGVGSRALHAGLLGLDTAVVLDEAHIAEPLRATVDSIVTMQASAPRSPRPALRLCSVSATHEAQGGFELQEAERREPAIARRIAASKTARLVAKHTTKDVGKLVGELTEAGAKVIGVVLNTVADARAAFAQLDPRPMTDGVLLIGPVRSLDRADLLAAIPDRARRAERESPFVVVATQTIEVGVDLDFDGLITACAPLDALVQRFGRLDRAGELGTSRAFVLAPPTKGCPVYGKTAEETWKWLTAIAQEETIDFGVEALRATIAEHGAPPSQQSARTIRLLDLHVDALTVTDAMDEDGPDIELLLHGDRRATADVAVAWRRLPAAADRSALPSEDVVGQELELRPLHPGETVTLSLAALRRWLVGDHAAVLSDVESIEAVDAPDSVRTLHEVTGWRTAADGTVTQILDPRSISPSDRVLLSARSGGLDGFGWAPEARHEVVDLGSLALRGPRVVLDGGEPDIEEVAESLASGDLTASQAARALAGPIARALPTAVASRPTFSDLVRRTAATLAAGRASLLEDGRVLVVGRGARTEDASSGRIVTLDEHQAAVHARAADTLAALDLDPALCAAVRRAARHHDEGKRDRRFQAWLRGGSTAPDAPLAKAAYRYDPARVRRLRESSGWPAGKRHELASAVAVQRALPEDSLAVWLVATHHGRNRPFPSAVEDDLDDELVAYVEGRAIPLPCAATLSPGSTLQTLVELAREYGQWGLAFLEALLMSADRAVSAVEARA
jgi:CRISPR-associated endonuclease/helicase Cas3